jgi:hypothetical protein
LATESLNDALPILLENIDELDATATVAFRQFIVNTRDAGLEIEALTNFIDTLTTEGAAALTAFAGDFKDLTDAQMTTIQDMFNLITGEMLANGKTILEILAEWSDMFDAAREAGVKLGGEFDFLRKIAKKMDEEGIRPLVERMDALNRLMEMTTRLGLLNQKRFDEFAASALDGYDDLIEAGFSMEEALWLSAPSLQWLIDNAKKYGLVIDEDTQALIDQGLANGILQEAQEDMNTILGDMRDIMGEIRDHLLGIKKDGTEAFDAVGAAAEEAAGRGREAWEEYRAWLFRNGFVLGDPNAPTYGEWSDPSNLPEESDDTSYSPTAAINSLEARVAGPIGRVATAAVAAASNAAAAASSALAEGSESILVRLLKKLIELLESSFGGSTGGGGDNSKKLTKLIDLISADKKVNDKGTISDEQAEKLARRLKAAGIGVDTELGKSIFNLQASWNQLFGGEHTLFGSGKKKEEEAVKKTRTDTERLVANFHRLVEALEGMSTQGFRIVWREVKEPAEGQGYGADGLYGAYGPREYGESPQIQNNIELRIGRRVLRQVIKETLSRGTQDGDLAINSEAVYHFN